MTEGSLDVKLPTIRTDGKPEVGRVRDEMRWEERRGAERRGEERRGEEEKRRDEKRRTEQNREDQRRERVRRKKMQVGEKVEKSWNTVFSIISGPGGSKSRLAKAAGAEPSGQMRDEKLHPHVARSTSPSQNVQNTNTGALLEIEMSKKCTPLWHEEHVQSTSASQHFLGIETSKKCMALWREAHFEVNMSKAHHARSNFGSWDVGLQIDR